MLMGTTIVLKKIMIEKHHLHVVVCAQSEAQGSTGEISTRAPTLLLVHLYLYSTGATSTSIFTLLVPPLPLYLYSTGAASTLPLPLLYWCHLHLHLYSSGATSTSTSILLVLLFHKAPWLYSNTTKTVHYCTGIRSAVHLQRVFD